MSAYLSNLYTKPIKNIFIGFIRIVMMTIRGKTWGKEGRKMCAAYLYTVSLCAVYLCAAHICAAHTFVPRTGGVLYR